MTTDPSLTNVDDIIDIATTAVAESDIQSAARLLKEAANALDECYAEKPDYDLAIHRYAIANRLQENLKVVAALIGGTLVECTNVILAEHKHGDNIDIEGMPFHRYDEEKANGVSYKTLYAKSKSYLKGAQLGAMNRMEKVQTSKSKTYFHLKTGVFKGKAKKA